LEVKIPIMEFDVEMECSACGANLSFNYRFPESKKFVVQPCDNCLLAHFKHHQKEVIEMACKEKKGGKVKK
jgi:hypothetical protein